MNRSTSPGRAVMDDRFFQAPPLRDTCADAMVYAFTTGLVADALAAKDGPGPGQRHAALRPGRHAGVGPLPRRDAYAR